MTQQNFNLVAGAVFGVVAMAHILRFLYGVEVVIGGFSVPMWWSGAAVIGAGALAVFGLRMGK